MGYNEGDASNRAQASEAISKMGLFWQVSIVLPILFWFGFTGFDFFNLGGFFPFIVEYVRWIYLLFCLIYLAIFSTKLMKDMNGGKTLTAWDLNRPNARDEYYKQVKADESSFVIISREDIFRFAITYVLPCMFLVIGFIFLLKGDFGILPIICIGLPLFSMLLQILFARNVVKYCKEINKFVEPATKRLFVYVSFSIVLILLSFVIAFFISGNVSPYKLVQISDGQLMVFYLDSNVIADCLSPGEVSNCSSNSNTLAQAINESELESTILDKNVFGLDNVKVFIMSTRQSDYIYGALVINRRNNSYSFSGICLPGDERKADYFDYVAPNWNESKLWNKVQTDEFNGLLTKVWDSNVKSEKEGEIFELGKELYKDFLGCVSNDYNLNSVCCLGVFE